MDTRLDYWEIKRVIERLVPRQTVLTPIERSHAIRRGRRAGYREYKLWPEAGWKVYERVMAADRIGVALEVSCKAATCPMPLNLDVWDGKVCWFNCLYCFANHFRDSLYTNFFDRVPAGLRQADWPQLHRALVWLTQLRSGSARGNRPDLPAKDAPSVVAAFRAAIPVRIGVRFENLLPQERRDGLTLRTLQLLAKLQYPVIIDTKSALCADDAYIRALADNPAGACVQISLSGTNEQLFKLIEPGAPSPRARFEALKRLNEAGVTAIPRIEPFLPFLSDSRDEMDEYIGLALDAGVEWVCWDAFSHSTANQMTRRLFHQVGLDFDRMFYVASDSRLLTGLLLYAMMRHFRQAGLKCSTYDDMNSHLNDDWLCCNVSAAFRNPGANLSSTKAVERYIREQGGRAISWSEYYRYVMARGGFLTPSLHSELWRLWNGDGNPAYSLAWLGLVPAGRDQDGLLWRWMGSNPNLDRAIEWIEGEASR